MKAALGAEVYFLEYLQKVGLPADLSRLMQAM